MDILLEDRHGRKLEEAGRGRYNIGEAEEGTGEEAGRGRQ